MMNKEEMIFDINEDIIMQIEMNSYMEYNDRIARMNDYIGEIYSYKDIEDMEALQEHHEKELAYKAIRQLQKENKQLKDRIKELEELNEEHRQLNGKLREENKQLKEHLCSRSDCSGRIKKSEKNDSLQQRIDKATEYIYYNSTRRKIFADIIDEYKNGEPKFYGNIKDLLEILKGESNEIFECNGKR